MAEDMTAAREKVCAALREQRLPRWEQLPDLELYMDQVLSLLERFLSAAPGFEEKGITASMVNNYVKLGVMPPPVKKRYTREHLAYLVMICVLKASLPMGAIRCLLASETAAASTGEVYDRFCAMYEAEGARAAGDHESLREEGAAPVFRSALRARAEQALALGMSQALEEK